MSDYITEDFFLERRFDPCYATTEMFDITIRCQRSDGHEGLHGNGPFIDFSTSWPPNEEDE